MEMISAAQYAEFKCCSKQAVTKRIRDGKLRAEQRQNQLNRPVYMLPLEQFDAPTQMKLRHVLNPNTDIVRVREPKKTKPLDSYTAAEREEIDTWTDLIEKWLAYRVGPNVKSMDQADQAWIVWASMEYPNMRFSRDILYRKLIAYREQDWDGLIDKRGKWRAGHTDVPQEIIDAFNGYYLNESRFPIARCMEYTTLYLQRVHPELIPQMPSYATMRRQISNIPEPVRVLGRYGAKAYYDKCSPHVRREYESIDSNDFWIADNHTFDVMACGENGKPCRLYLTAFMDARSGIFTGYYITDAPCSQATLIALRKGILKYGIPRNIYVDNGREFLTFDIGGRGHRAKKTLADGSTPFAPPGIFKRLGIEMTNAIVRNARAKIIERRFCDVKNHISRLFDTYTGGTVVEKPERLKHVLKAGGYVTKAEMIEAVGGLLDGYFNHEKYEGSVVEDQGKDRMDVFWERLHSQRKASPEDLTLMLMRSTRPQQIGRDGVFVPMAGTKLWFRNTEIHSMMGQQVYLRYDPEKLDKVRMYTLEDKFVMEVPRDTVLEGSYGDTKENVEAFMQVIRHAQKVTKESVKYARMPVAAHRPLDMLMVLAQETAENEQSPVHTPEAIELVQVHEEPLLMAVGDVDMSVMARNAAARRNTGGYEDE